MCVALQEKHPLDNCESIMEKDHVKVISMCVVPIKISHQNCKKIIRTYAMLNKYNQGSFIIQDLLKRLRKVRKHLLEENQKKSRWQIT